MHARFCMYNETFYVMFFLCILCIVRIFLVGRNMSRRWEVVRPKEDITHWIQSKNLRLVKATLLTVYFCTRLPDRTMTTAKNQKIFHCLFFYFILIIQVFWTSKKTTFKTQRLLDCLLYYIILCLSLIQYSTDCQLALHYVKAFSVNDSFRSVWQLCTVLYSCTTVSCIYKNSSFVFYFSKKKFIFCSFFPVFQSRIGSRSKKAKNNPQNRKKV